MKKENNFIIESGRSNVMLSAPHAYTHKRKGKLKVKDLNTDVLIKKIKELEDCHIMYTCNNLDYDPNYNLIKNNYKMELEKYIKENGIEYLIDIHGMKNYKSVEIDIGTRGMKNLNKDKVLLREIVKIMKQNIKKVKSDHIFKSSYRTISSYINKKTKIKTLQIEVSEKYRNKKSPLDGSNEAIDAISNIVRYLKGKEYGKINFISKYDDILDIKSAYKYQKEYKDISFDCIGLELEVAVNYDRNSFSFIKKILEKIKAVVGENGYFVKDGTIIGDYTFEIILDPLPLNKIIDIYEKLYQIIDFSMGTIKMSKENKCGLHANFNKLDITDLNVAHKKMIDILLSNQEFFDINKYKQKKLISNYEKHYKFQKDISDKYLWINYLKEKIVEVRNITAGINPRDLNMILSKILKALYYDKINIDDELIKNISISDVNTIVEDNYEKLLMEKTITLEIIDNKLVIK